MTLLHLPTTTSTMDIARQLVEEGDTTTTMVLADEQTAARGRHNRPWQTFGSNSLMVTYILRPVAGPHLPLIVALALHDALTALLPTLRHPDTPTSLAIKWPNDALLNGKKLAGILCENIGTKASIVGIGLNITRPETIPESFQGTFLNLEIQTKNMAESIWACLNPLLHLYQTQGWTQTLHNSYVQRCATIGQNIRWRVPQEGSDTAELKELTGLVRGLTPSGHLELVGEDGTVHVIHSGEIFDKRP